MLGSVACWCDASSADNSKLIGGCGGVECILQAMKAHPTHPSLQKQACGALRNLSVDGELIFPSATEYAIY